MSNEIKAFNKVTYQKQVAGISSWGEPITLIGEQLCQLEDGSVVEQYLYNIDGLTPENGLPFAALKGNIVVKGVVVEEVEKYECYSQITRTASRSGNVYKEWVWVGWSALPDLSRAISYKKKGKFLIVDFGHGLDRYDVGVDFEI